MSPRDAYEVLRGAQDQARGIWTRKVCPKCFGRLDPRDATAAWPMCDCAAGLDVESRTDEGLPSKVT